ncbi:MAG: hypothetical protein AVDCRST_MAG19-1228, partial [uncultured Thermomicrobiales bacterium]
VASIGSVAPPSSLPGRHLRVRRVEDQAATVGRASLGRHLRWGAVDHAGIWRRSVRVRPI